MLFLLRLSLFFFITDVASQNPSNALHPGDTISNFEPSLAVVIGLLSIIFSVAFVILLYFKFYCGTASTSQTRHVIQDGLLRSRPSNVGIEKSVIQSLPFFKFSYLKGSKDGLECAVCLEKFKDVELLRLLPKCKHAFHMDCIDQWLEYNSTCPLCRQDIMVEDIMQLPYSDSMRFLWLNQTELRQESNIELYLERDDTFHERSSQFCINSSFRKTSDKSQNEEDQSPIHKHGNSSNCENPNKPYHNINHKIIISDVIFKNRWSNVSSSDLTLLNSEMLNDLSSSRFPSMHDQELVNESKQTINIQKITNAMSSHHVNGSISEITAYPRFTDIMRNRDRNAVQIEVERTRRRGLPIARETVLWFADRERRLPQFQANIV